MPDSQLDGIVQYTVPRPAFIPKARVGEIKQRKCWQCGSKLRWLSKAQPTLFYYHIVADQIGNEHYVHKECVPATLRAGCTFVPPPEKPDANVVHSSDRER